MSEGFVEIPIERARKIPEYAKIIDAVYEWLVQDQGYPFNWFSGKPDWLDVRRLAEQWKKHDGTGPDTVEDYMGTIYAETGWDEDEG